MSAEVSIFTGTPTVFKGVEYNFWIDANPDGIGLGALDPLPDNVKHLLDKYVELQYARNQQEKIYWPLKSRHDSQYDVVLGVEKDLKILKYLSQDGDSPKYGDIEKTKLDLERQDFKFAKLVKSFDECQSKIGRIVEKKSETDERIVRLVLGTPLDLALFNYQALLIRGMPSVNDYIEKQSLKYKNLDGKSGGRRKHRKSGGRRKHRKSGGRRKRKDLESSDEESSDEEPDEESEYKFNKKGTFSMRRASSRFVTRFGSFFQKSRRDDPSN
ncbi:hypothetical protein RTP6_007495 [Batrachochytrium dendrobatidis]